MIRIVDDARTQVRRFTCLRCGSEFVADFEEVNRRIGSVRCPVCNAYISWPDGDLVDGEGPQDEKTVVEEMAFDGAMNVKEE